MLKLKARNVTILTEDEVSLVAGGADTPGKTTGGPGFTDFCPSDACVSDQCPGTSADCPTQSC